MNNISTFDHLTMDTLTCIWFGIVGVLDEHAGAITTIATIFIAAFTIALACSTKRLWREAKIASRISHKAANAAKESADATKESVDAMRENAERQLRAYVWTEITDKKDTPIGSIVYIKLQNSGQTPAYNVRCWATGGSGGNDFTFKEAPVEMHRPSFVIHPNTTHTLAVEEFSVSRDAKGVIERGKKIYVWGEVRYDDAFKKTPRKTQFRLFFHTYEHIGADGSAETMGIWRYCDEGNDAN